VGGAIIGLIRLRLHLRQLPDYLVNSHANANRGTDSAQTRSSTETQNSRISHPAYSAWPEVGGAAFEIRPFTGGWQCYEGPGVQPYWTGDTAKEDALGYATARVKFACSITLGRWNA